MTDEPLAEDAREADDMGERPDLGRKSDALIEAMSGSDMGSDTRAGSRQGGAATGSEIDPDQDAVNEALASEGMVSPDSVADGGPSASGTEQKANSGDGRPQAGGEADAATG